MPEIVVVDLGHATVDGEPVGSPLDVAWNRPGIEGIQGLVQTALQTWFESHNQAEQAKAAEALAEALALKDAEIAAKDAELAARDATIVDMNAQIEALGGTELGKKLAAEQARQRLAAKIAELNAELDQMGKA